MGYGIEGQSLTKKQRQESEALKVDLNKDVVHHESKFSLYEGDAKDYYVETSFEEYFKPFKDAEYGELFEEECKLMRQYLKKQGRNQVTVKDGLTKVVNVDDLTPNQLYYIIMDHTAMYPRLRVSHKELIKDLYLRIRDLDFVSFNERKDYEDRMKEYGDKFKQKREVNEKRVDKFIETADKYDQNLSERVSNLTTHNLDKSFWLKERKIPSEELLDVAMDNATKTFKVKSLSKSQKNKRGKKFNEKAKLQAKMMNTMNSFLRTRNYQLKDTLEHTLNRSFGGDWWRDVNENGERNENSLYGVRQKLSAESKFFFDSDNVNFENRTYFSDISKKHDEQLMNMVKDIAMYHTLGCGIKNKKNYVLTKQIYESGEFIEDIVSNTDKRNEKYIKMLEELEALDVSRFDYSSNEDFLNGEGYNSFMERLATLRYFSHALTWLEPVQRYDTIHPKIHLIQAKAKFVREILRDYESRALLIQSPYYALLASKDLDELGDDLLEKRIRTTVDPAVRSYLRQILTRRQMKDSFGRGKSAKKLLDARLQKAKENGPLPDNSAVYFFSNQEITTAFEEVEADNKAQIEKYTEDLAKKKETEYEDPTMHPAYIKIKDDFGWDVPKEITKNMNQKYFELHRKLNVPLKDSKGKIVPLYMLINPSKYNQIRACHSQMNNFGLQIAAMHHLNKKITDNIEAQAELTEMINDPERYHKYGKIRDEYFSLSNEMIDDTEDFLAKYKNAKQPEYENPVSTKLFLVGGESPEIHQENLKRIELWEKILKDKDINDSFKDNGVEFMKAVNAEFERALDPDKIDLNNL